MEVSFTIIICVAMLMATGAFGEVCQGPVCEFHLSVSRVSSMKYKSGDYLYNVVLNGTRLQVAGMGGMDHSSGTDDDDHGMPGMNSNGTTGMDGGGTTAMGGDDHGMPGMDGDDNGMPGMGGDDRGMPGMGGDDNGMPGMGGNDNGMPGMGGNDRGMPGMAGMIMPGKVVSSDQINTLDGIPAEIVVVNDQFPGPTIEVMEGTEVSGTNYSIDT